jgi:hypothetical protein
MPVHGLSASVPDRGYGVFVDAPICADCTRTICVRGSVHGLPQLRTVRGHGQSVFASCAWRVQVRGLPVPLSATAENGAALGADTARTPSPNEN